jgi:hypothetical protein
MDTSTPGLKTFWQKPEGRAGAVVLLAASAAGIYGFGLALPFLTAMLADTLHMAYLAGTLFAIFAVISNNDFRSAVKNGFQLIMRWSLGRLIELDPIGIEKNYRDDMTQEKVKLDKGVEGCAGAKEGLERNIANNNDAIQHAKSEIFQTDRMIASERNPVKLNGLNLSKQRFLEIIARKMATNQNLQKTLDMTNGLYERSQRMQQLAEYNIENLNAQIENDEQERNAILEAYKSLGPMQKLIRGEPEALKTFNAAREFAARDNSRMLGAMKDFSAYSEKYLTGMDIEQGAATADAEKMISNIEKTMQLTSGGGDTVPMGIVRADAVTVPNSSKAVSGDYLASLK